VALLTSTGALAQRAANPAAGGEALYARHCLVCHQADGRGVPNFQPPLVGGAWVEGEPLALAMFVLTGGFNSAERKQRVSDNVMPGFAQLSDEDMATLLSYVRHRFGGGAGAVTPEQVAEARVRTAMGGAESGLRP
jgi:mono/diheme cytochrome c family protein